jgi:alanyl-tRNA synthetase
MQSQAIRQAFLDFFRSKGHDIVASAPIVVQHDPTLLFTNAGMNPFKDIFLGNREASEKRVADTQKCLRVSGKHNDLEEVGVDTYHHTMFEMLGNWSFGDYFKAEAIDWAWELLTSVYSIDPGRIYVTVFAGDQTDKLEPDDEASKLWAKHLPPNRILRFGKKDNFWEMGDTGPCGPCSELHVDMRDEAERQAVDGATLVNNDHPQVIEIWNLVFIQFNRMADGSLQDLPARHVDTGMGFERLSMVLQNVKSTYDTDVFAPLLRQLEAISGRQYANDPKTDIAMRVIVDHIRAVSFTIADGQLPGNTGAGYVIRRILRRAVRYGYSYLGLDEPFFHQLVPVLAEQLKDAFPELAQQKELVSRVIQEEEISFLRTLSEGLKRLDHLGRQMAESGKGLLDGATAFELYDTFGFPLDLTRLVAAEKGLQVDEAGFDREMAAQKARSRSAAESETSDWIRLQHAESLQFVGYDQLETEAQLVMYRQVEQKKKVSYQLVLDRTPFYAESGGQIGDQGKLRIGSEQLDVLDTRKENDLIIHLVDKLPAQPTAAVHAAVDAGRRRLTAANHSATHLLHAALKSVLGNHVAQKGSYVGPDRLRFDFSHFSKLSTDELARVEQIVNNRIRENIALDERREVPMDEALSMGATALFGEKYGDRVRVITFDPDFSRELCGGTHVRATGNIGAFKIVSESAVAAGIRRIEAISGPAVEAWMEERLELLAGLGDLLKTPDLLKGVQRLQEENANLRKLAGEGAQVQLAKVRDALRASAVERGGVHWIQAVVEVPDAEALKSLSYELRQDHPRSAIVLGAELEGKALLSIMLSDALVQDQGWNAAQTIREAARPPPGGGGPQPVYATAGGKNPAGLDAAVQAAVSHLQTTNTTA